MKTGMSVVAFVCLIFLLHWDPTAAKRVLFYPVPGTSHIRYHTNVARAMSALGHDTWVCIPDYLSKTDYIDVSGINVLHYGHTLGNIEDRLFAETKVKDAYWENRTQSVYETSSLFSIFDEVMFSTLQEGFFDKVKDLNPDLFILDEFPFSRAMFVVPYKLNIPYAVMGSLHDVVAYRIPFSPAATPFQIAEIVDYQKFLDRFKSALIYTVVLFQRTVMDPDVVSMFAPEKPHKSVLELIAGAEVYIIEVDPIMDFPRPMLPNTKVVGGTTVKKAKPLQEPFKSFMEKSKKGVILVSFGTTVLEIPSYIFDKIGSACKASGLNIVWRSNRPSPDPKIILTSDWIPQNDIMGHVNTKLFVSHCGKNGQYEALYHGVPILCLPIFGDQPYNAERVNAKGYGLKADMRYRTTEELSDMIREILTNATYKDNISKASKLFRHLYRSPMTEAAFWLDHVMEYGGDYMRAASQKMPYYQYLMLDVIAVLFVIISLIAFVIFLLIRSCVRLVCKSKRSKSKSE